MVDRSIRFAALCLAFLSVSCASPRTEAEYPDAPVGTWRVTWIQGVPELGAKAVLEFGPGTVAGTAGVNRVQSTWSSIAPGHLRFGPVVATRRSGAPAAMRVERRLLVALEATRGMRVESGSLEFLDDFGRALVRLQAAE